VALIVGAVLTTTAVTPEMPHELPPRDRHVPRRSGVSLRGRERRTPRSRATELRSNSHFFFRRNFGRSTSEYRNAGSAVASRVYARSLEDSSSTANARTIGVVLTRLRIRFAVTGYFLSLYRVGRYAGIALASNERRGDERIPRPSRDGCHFVCYGPG
jgi:hypothetical protein